MDEIHLEGIAVDVRIGVYDWEKETFQRLLIDITLFTDTREAAQYDELILTVDYANVSAIVLGIVSERHFNLIETLAEEIARQVLVVDRVEAVRVAVSKPNAVAAAKNTRLVIQRTK